MRRSPARSVSPRVTTAHDALAAAVAARLPLSSMLLLGGGGERVRSQLTSEDSLPPTPPDSVGAGADLALTAATAVGRLRGEAAARALAECARLAVEGLEALSADDGPRNSAATPARPDPAPFAAPTAAAPPFPTPAAASPAPALLGTVAATPDSGLTLPRLQGRTGSVPQRQPQPSWADQRPQLPQARTPGSTPLRPARSQLGQSPGYAPPPRLTRGARADSAAPARAAVRNLPVSPVRGSEPRSAPLRSGYGSTPARDPPTACGDRTAGVIRAIELDAALQWEAEHPAERAEYTPGSSTAQRAVDDAFVAKLLSDPDADLDDLLRSAVQPLRRRAQPDDDIAAAAVPPDPPPAAARPQPPQPIALAASPKPLALAASPKPLAPKPDVVARMPSAPAVPPEAPLTLRTLAELEPSKAMLFLCSAAASEELQARAKEEDEQRRAGHFASLRAACESSEQTSRQRVQVQEEERRSVLRCELLCGECGVSSDALASRTPAKWRRREDAAGEVVWHRGGSAARGPAPLEPRPRASASADFAAAIREPYRTPSQGRRAQHQQRAALDAATRAIAAAEETLSMDGTRYRGTPSPSPRPAPVPLPSILRVSPPRPVVHELARPRDTAGAAVGGSVVGEERIGTWRRVRESDADGITVVRWLVD